jgi:putative glutamine amidotransferase
MRELREVKARRTEFELEVTEQALKKDLPVLGICGGAQAINVALGGSLYQDIATQIPGAGAHEQSARKERGGHRVDIAAGSRLHAIVERRKLEVNTTHHQAVKDVGHGLVVNATAEDGVIEGIESTRHRWILGVQWHPEVLAQRREDQRRIFSCFVAQCARSRSRA